MKCFAVRTMRDHALIAILAFGFGFPVSANDLSSWVRHPSEEDVWSVSSRSLKEAEFKNIQDPQLVRRLEARSWFTYVGPDLVCETGFKPYVLRAIGFDGAHFSVIENIQKGSVWVAARTMSVVDHERKTVVVACLSRDPDEVYLDASSTGAI